MEKIQRRKSDENDTQEICSMIDGTKFIIGRDSATEMIEDRARLEQRKREIKFTTVHHTGTK